MTQGMDTDGFAALMSRHQRLAADAFGATAPSAAERASLVDDIGAAGAVTPPGAARDTLRDLLYFWTGDQTSRGERPRDAPLPTLAPFVARPPDNAASSPLAGTQIEPAGLRETVRSPAALAAGPPPGLSLPSQLPPEPSPPSVGATPADVEAEARSRAILRIAALARQWALTRDPEASRGYLLFGKALAEATLYADDDPDIRRLVEASQSESLRSQSRRRWAWAGVAIIAALAVLGPIIVYLAAQAAASRAERDAVTLERDNLAKSDAENTRSRETMLDATRAAVDALAHSDIGPLNALLTDYGGASSAELARLQLAPATASSSTTEVFSAIAPARDAGARVRAEAVAVPGATCNGYLWFGSATKSLLADGRDPMTLKAGDVVTLSKNVDIRLRADWPNATTYAMSAQAGVVPAGSTVTITDAPRTFSRPSNPVWAPVKVPRAFCTTVFLQYVGDAAKKDAVLAALRDADVQTPPAEQVASAAGLAEVRCFWPEDLPVAEQVATALGSFAPDGKLKVVPLYKFAVKPSPGTIEVWLDLSK